LYSEMEPNPPKPGAHPGPSPAPRCGAARTCNSEARIITVTTYQLVITNSTACSHHTVAQIGLRSRGVWSSKLRCKALRQHPRAWTAPRVPAVEPVFTQHSASTEIFKEFLEVLWNMNSVLRFKSCYRCPCAGVLDVPCPVQG
jgi:hypothetical protein